MKNFLKGLLGFVLALALFGAGMAAGARLTAARGNLAVARMQQFQQYQQPPQNNQQPPQGQPGGWNNDPRDFGGRQPGGMMGGRGWNNDPRGMPGRGQLPFSSRWMILPMIGGGLSTLLLLGLAVWGVVTLVRGRRKPAAAPEPVEAQPVVVDAAAEPAGEAPIETTGQESPSDSSTDDTIAA